MIRLFFILLLTAVLSSCETDSYDSGDGVLSRLTTVFGETSYDDEGRAVRFVTDDNQTLNFSSAYGQPNVKLAGKVVRTLLYYYLTEDINIVKPYAIFNVLTTDVIDSSKIENIEKDPVNLEAVWLSNNKKYLNLSIKIKTSDPKNPELRHKLGMIYSGSNEGKTMLNLLHDNGNIPGNYTVNVYFSVRIESITEREPDCRIISVNAMTPDGLKTIEVKLR